MDWSLFSDEDSAVEYDPDEDESIRKDETSSGGFRMQHLHTP